MTEKELDVKKAEKTADITLNQQLILKMGGKAMIGTLAGYISGRFFKQMTDWAIFYAGLGCIMLGGLHHMQWITINWTQIDEDLLHVY